MGKNVKKCLITMTVTALAMLLPGCSDSPTSDSTIARGRRERITVYSGLSPARKTDYHHDLFEDFARETGVEIDLVEFGGLLDLPKHFSFVDWFARCASCDPVDILDNLDLCIENNNFDLYDPVFDRSKPDLIIASRRDAYILDKAEAGYFVPLSVVLEISPEYRVMYNDAFWDANSINAGNFGIPLYSFLHDDTPSYWIIDAQLRKAIFGRPIQSFSELLSFIEHAVDSSFADTPVVSTSTVPLGSIALHMGYGFEPIDIVTELAAPRLSDNRLAMSFQVTSYSGNDLRFTYIDHKNRNASSLEALTVAPIVLDAESRNVVDLLANPPDGLWDCMQKISDLIATGKIDTERSALSGFSALNNGRLKAAFVPDDEGLTLLRSLMMKHGDKFEDRFEIVPVSLKPTASLQATYFAYIPERTDKLEIIGKLFENLANPEVFDNLRLGQSPSDWQPHGADGVMPGNAAASLPRFENGRFFDVITRSGVPGRVPAIIPEPLRSAFRIDLRNEESYRRLVSQSFDGGPFTRICQAWQEFSPTYQKLIAGLAVNASALDYLRTYGEKLTSAITEELSRQIARETSEGEGPKNR